MSAGHAALERGGFDEARQAFLQAASLVPGSPQAAEGLARADEARRTGALGTALSKARGLDEREEWAAARVAYDAVLSIDGTVIEAQKGRARAEARAALGDRLAYHVAHPERFSTSAVREEAERLLAQAREVSPLGPRHAELVARLERALRATAEPVPTTLESDGRTDVTVLRVGRLGHFETKTLPLLPGTYTLVGSRPGYRDVRVSLEVEAGRVTEPLVIRCTEAVTP